MFLPTQSTAAAIPAAVRVATHASIPSPGRIHVRRAARDSLDRWIERQVRDAAPTGVHSASWRRVAAAYDAVQFTPLWIVGNRLRPRTGALVNVLAQADQQGLRRSSYPLRELATALDDIKDGSPTYAQLARADVYLTTCFVAYADDMLTGRVDPRSIESAWHIDPSATDVDSAVAHTLQSSDFAAALASLQPEANGYSALKRALAQYREIARGGGWKRIPEGAPIHPGDSSSRLAALRVRLAAEGFAIVHSPAATTGDATGDSTGDATGDATDSTSYGGGLANAVARFQRRHGLAEDTVLGPRTLAALNVPAHRRAEQIAANMERYRWLPLDLGDRYVVVNVPAFRLDAFDGGSRRLSMRVVVGSELAARHTPIFSDSMSYVQFGPYWNVPESIASSEIFPKARRDRSYLSRNHFQIVRGWGDNTRVVDASTLSNAALSSGRHHVRQEPGPDNALGRVKFIFPNDFNVYLHDTPATSLFDKRVRAYSHGCVRVDHPGALAQFVLRDRSNWTPERIQQTLADGARVRVNLPHKLPVYLLYLTAFEQRDHVAFREDLYNLDDPLIRVLDYSRGRSNAGALIARIKTAVVRAYLK